MFSFKMKNGKINKQILQRKTVWLQGSYSLVVAVGIGMTSIVLYGLLYWKVDQGYTF